MMNIGSIQIVAWVISLIITGGIGYGVGSVSVSVHCPAPETEQPAETFRNTRPNNSPAKEY